MVKLVTSRVHRCYSALGASRSARHERINDCIHVAAISLLLLASALELNQVNTLVKLDRHKVALVGAALLVLIQLFDLFAASNAHRIHYAPPRHSAKSRPFAEIPTKVDALVGTLCLIGALAILASSKLSASGKSHDTIVAEHIAVLATSAFVAAALVNTVFSIPSLIVKIPSPLARAHNAVSALFLAGATANVVVALANANVSTETLRGNNVLAIGAVLAYATVWLGAVLNVARTGALLQVRARGRDTLSSDDGSVKGRQSPASGGIFSWFRSNNKDNGQGGESDFDSDDIDEEEGYSSEEDLYTRRKTRR